MSDVDTLKGVVRTVQDWLGMPASSPSYAEMLRALGDMLLEDGLAVVTLPDHKVDSLDQPQWPINTGRPHDRAHVTMQSGAGWERLTVEGVGFPITDPDVAESVAAALLAGAEHMRSKR